MASRNIKCLVPFNLVFSFFFFLIFFDDFNRNIERALEISRNITVVDDKNSMLFNTELHNLMDILLLILWKNIILVPTRQHASLDCSLISGDMSDLNKGTFTAPGEISNHSANSVLLFLFMV